ncbi:putative phosphoenolpyruvate carboxykinase regulator transcription regulator protein [Oceanicola granulosus HTCC2516]|uniref:Putative phosphoenolpyruvate carboxykinase regulator transcription regulator protein n=1 Tax=Oceanicola granulosus (strain ATCC BAA-861 / DSM 15982 / KCTC 12143 / HTCC2516) TaxID=314256 RepID=Q2CF30_OCEGH|nr:LacI family DNA-binding transcriptional regulator [Oceanicola granulosus]EAR51297.1 putative phosphoenolpyruvate carboxykinase regulator transcription regulator protein [Oceanicola granulosus HTCC2516]
MRKITMADLARLAGVSPAAVSLALRGSSKISEATRERIRALAVEHGYVYDRQAAYLRTRVSSTIAMCLHTITNPTFSAILTSAERVFWEEGWTVMFGDSEDDLAKQRAFIARSIESNIAGLVVSPAAGTRSADLEEFRGHVPMVLASREVEATELDLVRIDYVKGIELAVAHLAELGHRRIAWIGRGAETGARPPGFASFVAALEARGLAFEPRHGHFCDPDRRSGYDGMTRLLETAPEITAVLCFSDMIAIGALRALHEAGRAPGRDVSVVGFDDLDEAQYATPPLTTVRIDLPELGRAAARTLLDRMADPAAPQRLVKIDAVLVPRGTTAPPREGGG